MNRRSLLALLGAAAAAPATGAKTAAAALGVSPNLADPFPPEIGATCGSPAGPTFHSWWGSRAQAGYDATIQSRHQQEQERYSHMKSWGAGFRNMMIRRDIMIEAEFRRRCESDEDFLLEVLKGL